MTKVILDPAMLAKLNILTEPVEIVNPAGQVLGLYTPLQPGTAKEPQISEEEFQQRELEREELTTAELLAFLDRQV